MTSPPGRPDSSTPSRLSFPVVGLGGSAGGLQALMTFFEHLPANPGMAFVVILHLSPHHESNAAQILQRSTPMPVQQVTDTVAIEVDHVYVIPPHFDLRMHGEQLELDAMVRPVGSAVAIDLFFRTLAQTHQDLAFCVVLSGTGSDGATGLGAVKGEGGVTLAQSPDGAEWADMPRAAIATGLVDIVLPVEQLGKRLVELALNAKRLSRSEARAAVQSAPQTDHDPALQEILDQLRTLTGHDFRHYKLGTVMRRIERRLQVNGLSDLATYRDFLKAEPGEARPLLQDLLISVTRFFRDADAFSGLASDVIPALLDSVAAGDPLRIWVAGCATGEECYSVGMLLNEAMASRDLSAPVQLFATDIDARAIQTARRGVYESGIAADVSPERLRRFFVVEGAQYRVIPLLREQVLFAEHNLLRDPPFSKVHLICCRNLLIYLDPAAQASTLEMFHYALVPGGYLLLGGSESADAAKELFSCVDAKNRIFRALPGRVSGARLMLDATGLPHAPSPLDALPADPAHAQPATDHPLESAGRAHQDAISAVASASVLIDAQHHVLHLSPTAGRFMTHTGGVPSNNLLDNVDADLRLELRTALFQATLSAARMRVRVARAQPATGGGGLLDIVVHPISAEGGQPARILVVFEEVDADAGTDPATPGAVPVIHDAEGTARVLLDQADDEIRRLKSVLQGSLERSAHYIEELRSANEELQAINEELRSASEELETSKEELHSMNEELLTVNGELSLKVEERGRLTDDLQNLIASSEIATVFVDAGMCIQRFTPHASQLFNLIASDVGRPLLDITSSLDYAGLAADAETVFRLLQPIERQLEASNGRHYLARILPYRTAGNTIAGAVLTFIDVTRLQRAEARMRTSEERLRVATPPAPPAPLAPDEPDRTAPDPSARDMLTDDAKHRFLSLVSHELRQPLNLIAAHAELLLRLPETSAIPSVQRIGSTIQRAVGSQSRLIDALLDLSRVRSGGLRLNLEAVELGALMRTLAAAAGSDMERKQLRFELQCDADLALSCPCDRARVEQIVRHLLANAMQRTPADGFVRLALTHDAQTAWIEVTDSGSGIAPDVLPRIFDLFGRADPAAAASHPGLDIGLTLVRGWVEAHGGTVEARSPGLGGGSTFRVGLPLSAGRTGTAP